MLYKALTVPDMRISERLVIPGLLLGGLVRPPHLAAMLSVVPDTARLARLVLPIAVLVLLLVPTILINPNALRPGVTGIVMAMAVPTDLVPIIVPNPNALR